MSESNAAHLDPAQAAELARVIDLHARWENLRANPARLTAAYSVLDLQELQRAFEAYRVRQAAYTARYHAAEIPELTRNSPERVGTWCRVVRAVFRRAEREAGSAYPAHAVEESLRLADQIAARRKKDPVERVAPENSIGGAIRILDMVIRWCDGLADPVAPPGDVADPSADGGVGSLGPPTCA